MSLGPTLAILTGLCSLAVAQPSLTTIEDTIYKADGTRFNGTALITWNSFQTNDSSNVGMQSLTVPIQNGILWVQLVPNMGLNPAAPYTVNYNSDGRQQFTEVWVVPATTKILRLRDVRTNANSLLTGTVPQNQTPIMETDVVGLVADFGLRPVKGPGFSAGRASVINASGQIDGAAGNLGDCVHVDGTSSPCSTGSQPSSGGFVDAESPAGALDGSNASFTLSTSPAPPSSLALFRNGILQKPGFDYTLSSAAIQFLGGATPQPGDVLVAYYRTSAAGSITTGQVGSITTAASAPMTTYSPQVICSSLGLSTTTGTLTSLGSCTVPGNLFRPGDRVEILFDLMHQGSGSGFNLQVNWGGTTLVQRNADAGETMITGRTEIGVAPGVAPFSSQSWGGATPLQSLVGSASDSVENPLKISFSASSGGDTVALRNFAVIRYPAISNP